MRIKASPFQRFRTPNGKWVQIQDLEFGDTLTSATYNPNHRHPFVGQDEIQHVHRLSLEESAPLYSFQVTGDQNCFLAEDSLNDGVVTLLASSAWRMKQA